MGDKGKLAWVGGAYFLNHLSITATPSKCSGLRVHIRGRQKIDPVTRRGQKFSKVLRLISRCMRGSTCLSGSCRVMGRFSQWVGIEENQIGEKTGGGGG